MSHLQCRHSFQNSRATLGTMSQCSRTQMRANLSSNSNAASSLPFRGVCNALAYPAGTAVSPGASYLILRAAERRHCTSGNFTDVEDGGILRRTPRDRKCHQGSGARTPRGATLEDQRPSVQIGHNATTPSLASTSQLLGALCRSNKSITIKYTRLA